ncbi:unnamed protein product [Pieris macdunnoughi]|uniref:Endonuclease/exonuclease/phosphatase domain-containing protein n=1 Tax=Pieris macdunnoughi TaxID=345717 RepID=A0A821YA05_9NEOP|nr:unnamed protein product [Pieris macdunnoughi]
MLAALVQEPYTGSEGRVKEQSGARVYQHEQAGATVTKAAIFVFDEKIEVIQFPEWTTPNVVVVKLRTEAWEITLVSFYLEPDPKDVQHHIDRIQRICDRAKNRIILAGDANAKSPWWCSPNVDHRGDLIADTLHSMNFEILNNSNIPTFDTVRGGKSYRSYVDITACTADLLAIIDEWSVEEGLVSSDHNGITFKMRLERSEGRRTERTTRKYNTRKANWSLFEKRLSELLDWAT